MSGHPKQGRLEPSRLVFIGDAVPDYEAVQRNRIFFEIVKEDEVSPFPDSTPVLDTVILKEGRGTV